MKLRGVLALILFVLTLFGIPFAAFGLESEKDFQNLHRLIKPGPGESRWMEIDWYPSVWEGWKVAAAEGKPIFFLAGSGGAPCAGC